MLCEHAKHRDYSKLQVNGEVATNYIFYSCIFSSFYSSSKLCHEFSNMLRKNVSRGQCAPVYQSSNLVGTLRLIDSIGLWVERPYSPSS